MNDPRFSADTPLEPPGLIADEPPTAPRGTESLIGGPESGPLGSDHEPPPAETPYKLIDAPPLGHLKWNLAHRREDNDGVNRYYCQEDETYWVEPSKEISTYVDRSMFEAAEMPEDAIERPRVHLLSATPDPLGAVAAFSMMYEGRPIRDLAEITDDERRHYFDECFKTALRTPLEAIDLHFMVEGMTRATFDQMRTQRTAVYAGESLRFAVKEDLKDSVRPGPLVATNKDAKAVHDAAVTAIHSAYLQLISLGIPAEDARGLLPMNVLTRAHWKTNLRNLEAEVGKRLCTQAQFEWRLIHADLRRAIREYKGVALANGPHPSFWCGKAWQFEYIAESPMFQPICFQKGACMFKASMDRGCTIRERVDAGRFDLIETAEWLADPTAAWVR